MHVIRISAETMKRLKIRAEPIEDPAESALVKGLDAADRDRQRTQGELYPGGLTPGELRRGAERVRRRDPTAAAALEPRMDRTARHYRIASLVSITELQNGGTVSVCPIPFRMSMGSSPPLGWSVTSSS